MRRDQRYAAESESMLTAVFGALDGIRLRPAPSGHGGALVELSRFHNAVLVANQFAEIVGEDAFMGGPDVFDFWPVHGRGASVDITKGELTLHRVETARPRDIRGKVRRVMPRMLRVQRAHINLVGHGTTVERWLGVTPDGDLIDIGQRAADALPMQVQEQETIYIIAGMHLNLEYSWTVSIRRTGGTFALRIPTDSRGARKLLSLRDVPDGRERRAALRHWVSQHQRRVLGPEETTEVDVRSHLRGATPFAWEDFSGIVTPSPYDLRLNGTEPQR